MFTLRIVWRKIAKMAVIQRIVSRLKQSLKFAVPIEASHLKFEKDGAGKSMGSAICLTPGYSAWLVEFVKASEAPVLALSVRRAADIKAGKQKSPVKPGFL